MSSGESCLLSLAVAFDVIFTLRHSRLMTLHFSWCRSVLSPQKERLLCSDVANQVPELFCMNSLYDSYSSWHLCICHTLLIFDSGPFFVSHMFLKGTFCCDIRRNFEWSCKIHVLSSLEGQSLKYSINLQLAYLTPGPAI